MSAETVREYVGLDRLLVSVENAIVAQGDPRERRMLRLPDHVPLKHIATREAEIRSVRQRERQSVEQLAWCIQHSPEFRWTWSRGAGVRLG